VMLPTELALDDVLLALSGPAPPSEHLHNQRAPGLRHRIATRY
jgi:hypothetical protein